MYGTATIYTNFGSAHCAVLCKEKASLMSSEEESEGCNRLRKLYIYNSSDGGWEGGNHLGGCVTVYV